MLIQVRIRSQPLRGRLKVMDTARYSFQRADLVGGHVVLDLVNTVTGRRSRPTDWLEDYDRVLEWAALTDAFDANSLQTLHRMSEGDPHTAMRAVHRLREFREATYEIVSAAISAEPIDERALTTLERHWKSAVSAASLTFADGQAEVLLAPESSQLDYPRHVLALAALELLRTLPLERIRECAAGCGWIFIDISRGGQRRWCDMATCGNRAKSRRHYDRTRAARSRAD
jgi:predicted RNA-binding Zn ribbon-like protein